VRRSSHRASGWERGLTLPVPWEPAPVGHGWIDPSDMGCKHTSGTQPGVQWVKWRRLPLELDVEAVRRDATPLARRLQAFTV